MNKRLIIILVLVGLALILIFQNTQSVYLHISFWKLVQPMVVLVVTLFALGFVIGFLAAKMKGPRAEKPRTGAPVKDRNIYKIFRISRPERVL